MRFPPHHLIMRATGINQILKDNHQMNSLLLNSKDCDHRFTGGLNGDRELNIRTSARTSDRHLSFIKDDLKIGKTGMESSNSVDHHHVEEEEGGMKDIAAWMISETNARREFQQKIERMLLETSRSKTVGIESQVYYIFSARV